MTSDINWNPGWPGQVGNQHREPAMATFPVTGASSTSRFGTNLLITFTPTSTVSVPTMRVFSTTAPGNPDAGDIYNNLGVPLVAEVFQDGDQTTPFTQLGEYRAAAISGTGMYNENLTAASANRLTSKSDGLFVVCDKNGRGLLAKFGDNINLFPLTRTVLRVGLYVRTNAYFRAERLDNFTSKKWIVDVPNYSPTGYNNWELWSGELKTDFGSTEWSFWQPQDIRDFSSAGGPRSWIVRCMAGGGGAWKLDYLAMRVLFTESDRLGMGICELDNVGQAFKTFTLTDNSGSPLVMAGGVKHTILIRQMYDTSDQIGAKAVINVRGPVSPVGDHPEWEARTMAGYGGTTVSEQPIAALPAIFFEGGGQVRPFSQPYGLNRGIRVLDTEEYFATQSLTITGAATSELYGQVITSVGIKGVIPASTRLRCEVLDSSEERVLGPAEVTVTDILRLPLESNGAVGDEQIPYRRVRFLFDEASTLAAGVYTVKITCPDNIESEGLGTAGNGFRIGALHWVLRDETLPTPDRTSSANDAADGAVDHAEGYVMSGPGDVRFATPDTDWSSDLQLVLATVPEAVEGVVASEGVLTTHNAEVCSACNNSGKEDCSSCSDATLPYAYLVWEEPEEGDVAIAHFDVERQDDFHPNWERVAKVALADGTTFTDYEVSIGIQSRYRVRSVNEDGVPGAWSSLAYVSVGEYGGDIGRALSFSSNLAINLAVVYPEVFGDGEVLRNFTFQEAGDVSFTSIYGRERQVAFWPVERKGITFTRTLLLNAICTVQPPTMGIFEPLRVLSRLPVPYVCVRDGEGNRWYANLRVTEGANRRPGELWYASVTVTEVSAISHVYDSTAEQVEVL